MFLLVRRDIVFGTSAPFEWFFSSLERSRVFGGHVFHCLPLRGSETDSLNLCIAESTADITVKL